jgi:tRNA pseudouridine32 synthase/23S rRNA pseudouridine746 synthase
VPAQSDSLGVTWLEPQPAASERPAVLPSPFDELEPHPLARRCAELVMQQLRGGLLAPGLSTEVLRTAAGGKMFGVLAFEAADGRVGFLRAVSGQVERSWSVEGYAGAVFDPEARAAVEPPAEVVVKRFTARVEEARADPALLRLRAELVALEKRHREERAALKARYAERRQRRHAARAQAAESQEKSPVTESDGRGGRRTGEPRAAEGRSTRASGAGQTGATPSAAAGEGSRAAESAGPSAEGERTRAMESPGWTSPTSDGGEEARAAESRADDAERREFERRAREETAAAHARLRPLERRLAALERLRRLISREAMRRIWDTYVLRNFAGEARPLRALFAPGDPPSGAADCAAPRLLDAARRQGWRPLALAEFWWGAAPPGGARVEGAWYPACREKCGPVLPFLLRGLEVAPRRTFRPPEVPEPLRVVFEDERFVVIDKPAGLLSVPARDEAIEDDVLARLRQRYPRATGPLAVHRLDLDTSGLMLVALDDEAYRLLQQQFLTRVVQKRYVALLDGDVRGDEGVIELPMRVDLDHRPRQVVDFEHGRAAVTRWQVLSRSVESHRTRVAFFPLTGRTHQLRVHAAHAGGLAAPIVGDRLYGQPADRLYLHAESLRFAHPSDLKHVVEVSSPAPF